MKLIWQRRVFPLARTFRISRRLQTVFRTVIVRLYSGGTHGLGEAVPDAYFAESAAGLEDDLAAIGEVVAPLMLTCENLDAMLDAASARLRHGRSALAGLDLAAHDLLAKAAGMPVWKLLGLAPPKPTPIAYCVDIRPLKEMIRQAARHPDRSFIKIKLGCPHDVEAVQEIRSRTRARLRLDPNAAWTVEEAIDKLRRIGPDRIEFVEQPIPPGDPAGLDRIRRRSGVPVVVDEGVATSADLPPLRGRIDGINIKLMKCGGLREALRMIAFAREEGWRIMLGCRIESSLGITAAAHLLGAVDDADLDGHLFLGRDPFRGATLDGERLLAPEGPGLGVSPADAALEREPCGAWRRKTEVRDRKTNVQRPTFNIQRGKMAGRRCRTRGVRKC